MVYINTEDISLDIAKDLERRFDTSNYELERPLPKGKNKKVIGLMKDEIGEEILIEFAALKLKTYSFLTGDYNGNKKKGTKKVTKQNYKFEGCKHC